MLVVKSRVEAIYEGGVFRPVDPPGLSEGERVSLTVERVAAADPETILGLAGQVYAGLSAQDVDEVEAHARRRSLFDAS